VSLSASFDPAVSSDVAAFIRTVEGKWGPLDTRVGASDEMYAYERSWMRSEDAAAVAYFFMGNQLFQTIEEVVDWRFAGFGGVGAFLDFASGFGRVTRFLVRALPPERLVVAEIDPAAIAFQKRAFGVRGVVSATVPSKVQLPDRGFDLIFVSSLFSHLPPVRFEEWLHFLYGRLEPSGLLAFSVHGLDRIQDPNVDCSSGFVYAPVSETTRLDTAEYGSAYVSEERVRQFVDRVAGREGRLYANPLAFGGTQDLYLLVRPPVPDLPPPRLSRAPTGEVENATIVDGLVSAEGWTRGVDDEAPPIVRLFLRDRPAEVELAPGASTTERRWRIAFPVDTVGLDGLVRIEAESARGGAASSTSGTCGPTSSAPGALIK
jgi:SAM-dependent methyltransferase